MFVGLLAGKLDREFQRSPADIEDLLTSVVFGSCQYVAPSDALLRFLGEARTLDRAQLGPLTGYTSASYEFWPRWRHRVDSLREDETKTTCDENAIEGPPQSNEPDVVVKLDGPAGAAWILVEVKMRSGKSSLPTPEGLLSDQLARYWVELKSRAEAARAIPLALVYVTLGATMPEGDLRQTQDELAQKAPSAAPAPLYWLSWRDFTTAAIDEASPKILKDLGTLLHRWHIKRVKMGAWPDPPPTLSAAELPIWTFKRSWRWRLPPAERTEWRFFTKEQDR